MIEETTEEYNDRLVACAWRALTVYRERGGKALAALQQQDMEGFLAYLRRRAAAYADFRALDAKAMGRGIDLASQVAFQELWQQTAVEHLQLAALMDQAKLALAGQISGLKTLRRGVEAYHSRTSSAGVELEPKLVKRI